MLTRTNKLGRALIGTVLFCAFVFAGTAFGTWWGDYTWRFQPFG
jgi:hypothetical protein